MGEPGQTNLDAQISVSCTDTAVIKNKVVLQATECKHESAQSERGTILTYSKQQQKKNVAQLSVLTRPEFLSDAASRHPHQKTRRGSRQQSTTAVYAA